MNRVGTIDDRTSTTLLSKIAEPNKGLSGCNMATGCSKRKGFCFLVACMAVAGSGLMIAALATPHWFISSVEYDLAGLTNATTGQNPTPGEKYDRGTYLGYLVFGLFEGTTYLHTLISFSAVPYKTFSYLEDVFNLGLWVFTIVMCILAPLTGLVTAVLGFYNTLRVPISLLYGTTGMYIWNSISFSFSAAAVATFLAQYYTVLANSAVSRDDSTVWTQEDISVDYSFWIAVGALAAFSLNFILIRLAVWGHESDPVLTITQQYHRDRDKDDSAKDVGLQMMY